MWISWIVKQWFYSVQSVVCFLCCLYSKLSVFSWSGALKKKWCNTYHGKLSCTQMLNQGSLCWAQSPGRLRSCFSQDIRLFSWQQAVEMRIVIIKICPYDSNRQAIVQDTGKKISPQALGKFLFNITLNDLHAPEHPSSSAHQPALYRRKRTLLQSTAVALHRVPTAPAAAALMPQTSKKYQPRESHNVPRQACIDGKTFPDFLHRASKAVQWVLTLPMLQIEKYKIRKWSKFGRVKVRRVLLEHLGQFLSSFPAV